MPDNIEREAVRLKAIELWHEAVGKGDDYACKYWGIGDCFYH